MNFLYFFIYLSFETSINHLKLNKSIIYNLVLKKQFDHSPMILYPQLKAAKTTLLVKNICYSYSNTQFIVSYSQQSIWVSNSNFIHLLNNVISSEKYLPPDFNDMTFFTTPVMEGKEMFTFRLCIFMDISNVNNNNQPALSTTNLIFRVYSCRFRNCANTQRGGAIYVNGPKFLLVNDCDFISCRSDSDGGAFYCANSAIVVFRNAFQFCSSGNIGGAFMCEDSSHYWDLIIQSNLFSRCQAPNYNYFFAKFHQVANNTAYLYFNKFRCLKEEAGSYYIIQTHENRNATYSVFRNVYGDDNYNIHLPPTKTFSPLPTLSPTPPFTASVMFSPSKYFTCSLQFTATEVFTKTSEFTDSNTFTPSSLFTPSQPFTQSIPYPSISISASQTPHPTPSQSSIQTPARTPTQSSTSAFTPSNFFAPPTETPTPDPSETPTLSKTPCITWPNLSLGLIILAGIILLLGIIANIYLIMLCCKPSEIFIQQVL